jgi:hypothetical protein
VNPIYFVFFTTATLVASAIMYQVRRLFTPLLLFKFKAFINKKGWNSASAVNTITLLCGFLIIFMGVYLLDSIARGGGAQASMKPTPSSLGQEELDVSSQEDQDEKTTADIFHTSGRKRSRAASI